MAVCTISSYTPEWKTICIQTAVCSYMYQWKALAEERKWGKAPAAFHCGEERSLVGGELLEPFPPSASFLAVGKGSGSFLWWGKELLKSSSTSSPLQESFPTAGPFTMGGMQWDTSRLKIPVWTGEALFGWEDSHIGCIPRYVLTGVRIVFTHLSSALPSTLLFIPVLLGHAVYVLYVPPNGVCSVDVL